MRVMLDTNVLVSAALNADGLPYLAFRKAVEYPNQGLVCEQIIRETRRVFNKKMPHLLTRLEDFFSEALPDLEPVPIPTNEIADELRIRDAKDRPILRAAIGAQADVLVTGDRDFLESGLTKPFVVTPADFLRLPGPAAEI